MASSTTETRLKKSKAQLWQEMKIHSITRALTLLYTISLLTMFTRIQLNLLGRRTYLSSVVQLASPPAQVEDSRISMENRDDDNYENMYGNDFETNRKYLTFSWWLLHRGSKQIMERVMVVVKEVFGAVNIREDISLDRLSELVMQCRRNIEGHTEEERREAKWLEYLLPPKDKEAFVIRQSTMSESEDSPSPEARATEDPMTASAIEAESITGSLRRLLDETSDLIDSPTFTLVLSRLLDASFSHLVDYRIATEAYKVTGLAAPGTEQPRITEIPDTKCKLAHILPIFCRQAHVMATGSGELDAIAGVASQQALGNEYLAAIDQVHDLGAFAAVIYSSNFEYEVAESASTTAPQSEAAQPSPLQPVLDNLADVAESASELREVEPKPVSESSLGDQSARVQSSGTVQESTAAEAVQPGDAGFEAVWKKALADEDGKQADG